MFQALLRILLPSPSAGRTMNSLIDTIRESVIGAGTPIATPFYHFDTSAGVWRYQDRKATTYKSLDALSFATYCNENSAEPARKIGLQGLIEEAEQTLLGMHQRDGRSELVLSDNAEHLRWFVLPQDVAAA